MMFAMDETAQNSMEKGTQPLDHILTELGLKNSDLIANSTEQLTFKVVAKGRRGRCLTLKVQMKILNALNTAQNQNHYELKDAFNYKGKK
jgi:hypothetical protein